MTTPRWADLAVIFLGGCLGTAARSYLVAAFTQPSLGLALANFSGCLGLGLIAGYFGTGAPLVRIFLAVGVVASFTSWSSLALYGTHSLIAFLLVLGETLLGIGLAAVGHELGRRWSA